jgi:hypothetical protein
MRRSASTAPECGTNLNALLLIGSIRWLGLDIPEASGGLAGREADHSSGRSLKQTGRLRNGHPRMRLPRCPAAIGIVS